MSSNFGRDQKTEDFLKEAFANWRDVDELVLGSGPSAADLEYREKKARAAQIRGRSQLFVSATSMKTMKQLQQEASEESANELDWEQLLIKYLPEMDNPGLDSVWMRMGGHSSWADKLVAEMKSGDEVVEPLKRGSATLCLTPERDRLILFGGRLFFGKHYVLNDMSIFDLATLSWRFYHNDLSLYPNNGGPSHRYGHSATIVGDDMYVYGGSYMQNTTCAALRTSTNQEVHSVLEIFNLRTMEWERDPSSRISSGAVYLNGGTSEHTMTLLPPHEGASMSSSNRGRGDDVLLRMVKLGGSQGSTKVLESTDHGLTWAVRKLTVLRISKLHTANVWINSEDNSRHIIVYGGIVGQTPTNLLESFETSTMNKTVLQEATTDGYAPAARSGHSACVSQDKLFVVGGYVQERGYTNEVIVYDLVENLWVQTIPSTSPLVRGVMPTASTKMASVAVGSRIYMFGGYSGSYHGGMSVLDFLPEWEPEIHHAFPDDFRLAVKTLLMMSQISPDGFFPMYDDEDMDFLWWMLPTEVVLRVIRHLARVWT